MKINLLFDAILFWLAFSCGEESIPNFSLPLPGGKSWKLTVEAGGLAYDGTVDLFHTGIKFYSLDFSPFSKSLDGKIMEEKEVPILAMAGGMIYEVGTNAFHPNGYYVRIDHDRDGLESTGYQSISAHLRDTPIVSVKQFVVQGQKIGVMGSTGHLDGEPTSTGRHVHITFYYKGTGSLKGGDSEKLNLIMLEGKAIKEYKVEALCYPWGFEPAFYPSFNFIVKPPDKLRVTPSSK